MPRCRVRGWLLLATPAATAPQASSRCLLLSLSLRSLARGSWHARVVATSGQVLDFESPFELVRFLSQAPLLLAPARPVGTEAPAGGPGLR